jgi:hypothetical protein
LLDGVELKFSPLIVTTEPVGPEMGAKEVIVGGALNLARTKSSPPAELRFSEPNAEVP